MDWTPIWAAVGGAAAGAGVMQAAGKTIASYVELRISAVLASRSPLCVECRAETLRRFADVDTDLERQAVRLGVIANQAQILVARRELEA